MTLLALAATLLAAPPGAVEMATRLGLPAAQIQTIEPVIVDARTVGHLVRHAHMDRTQGVFVPWRGPRVSLGAVKTFEPRGVIDLAGAGALPIARTHARQLSAQTMTDPAWILVTRHQKAATGLRKRKGRFEGGKASSATLHLIRLRDLRRVLQLKIERRSSDGFGGHDISGLTLKRDGDVVEIIGTRQDRLPAHRARCMKPPPVPVRYVLHDGVFREVDAQATVGCGRRPAMPKAMPKP